MDLSNIEFNTQFLGENGTVSFSGDGVDKTVDSGESFIIRQNEGFQNVRVSGVIPAGGSVKIEVRRDDTMLTSRQYFGVFKDQISYFVNNSGPR